MEATIESIEKKVEEIKEYNKNYFLNQDSIFVEVLLKKLLERYPDLNTLFIIEPLCKLLGKKPV